MLRGQGGEAYKEGFSGGIAGRRARARRGAAGGGGAGVAATPARGGRGARARPGRRRRTPGSVQPLGRLVVGEGRLHLVVIGPKVDLLALSLDLCRPAPSRGIHAAVLARGAPGLGWGPGVGRGGVGGGGRAAGWLGGGEAASARHSGAPAAGAAGPSKGRRRPRARIPSRLFASAPRSRWIRAFCSSMAALASAPVAGRPLGSQNSALLLSSATLADQRAGSTAPPV
jgi:hypothetical protein